MKTKGITIWEQHAEKFVLGLSGLLFVGFTALQFVGQPNAVMVGTVEMTPSNVDGYLQEAAEKLQSKMESSAAPSLPIPKPVTAYENLQVSLASSICPETTIDFPQCCIVPQAVIIQNGKKEVRFVELNFTAPDRIAVTQTTDTLADGVVQQVPALEAYLSDKDVPDITWTTIFVQFDREALMQQVRGELLNEDEDIKSIPSSWYDSPLTIVDVRFERETLEDGHWTSLTTLEQIPARRSLREALEKEITNVSRNMILSDAQSTNVQEDITQPAFYATRNDSWAPVSLREDIKVDDNIPGEDPQLRALRRKLRSLLIKEANQIRKLDEAGGPLDKDGPPGGIDNPPGGEGGGRGDGGRGGGRGGRGGGDAGGGGKGPPGPGGTGFGTGGGETGRRNKGGADSDQNRLKRIVLTKKLVKLQKEITRVRKKLPDDIIEDEPVDNGLDESALLVWAHDLTAKPGITYRYRASVSVYNPFFGKRRNLSSDQEHLSESFTLTSTASEWSQEITINSRLQWYITSATAPGQRGGNGSLGLGLATAEVFRYFDGREWMKVFKVQPGEHIGGIEMQREGDIEVDFSTGIYVLDIIGDIDATANGNQVRPGQAARVLLQDTSGSNSPQMRHPQNDSNDPERQDLRYRVQERKRLARNDDGG